MKLNILRQSYAPTLIYPSLRLCIRNRSISYLHILGLTLLFFSIHPIVGRAEPTGNSGASDTIAVIATTTTAGSTGAGGSHKTSSETKTARTTTDASTAGVVKHPTRKESLLLDKISAHPWWVLGGIVVFLVFIGFIAGFFLKHLLGQDTPGVEPGLTSKPLAAFRMLRVPGGWVQSFLNRFMPGRNSPSSGKDQGQPAACSGGSDRGVPANDNPKTSSMASEAELTTMLNNLIDKTTPTLVEKITPTLVEKIIPILVEEISKYSYDLKIDFETKMDKQTKDIIERLKSTPGHVTKSDDATMPKQSQDSGVVTYGGVGYSQTSQAHVNDNNPDSVVSWDDSGVGPGVASKPTEGFSNAIATVLAKDHQASPSDDSPPTVSSANSDQHDDSCSSVSIVAKYQQALDRGERSLPASLFLAELNITKDAEDALMRFSNVPTQLMTVPGGGSYLLVAGKDHRHWLVPDFKTLSSFKSHRPNKRIFSYEAQAIHTPELRQPAEVKLVGDLWEVVNMGVIAVPG